MMVIVRCVLLARLWAGREAQRGHLGQRGRLWMWALSGGWRINNHTNIFAWESLCAGGWAGSFSKVGAGKVLRQHPFARWSYWSCQSKLGEFHLSWALPREVGQKLWPPSHQTHFSAMKMLGQTSSTSFLGASWRSWIKARWRSRTQGVLYRLVSSIFSRTRLYRSSTSNCSADSSMPGHSASTLTPRGLSSRVRSSILIKEKEHHDPPCSLRESTLGPFSARTLCMGWIWSARKDLTGISSGIDVLGWAKGHQFLSFPPIFL